MKLAALLVLVAVQSAAAQPGRREPDRALTYAVPIDGYPGDGPADAKVTLVIAHGYADPYSEKVRSTLDELRRKYNQELRVVFRNVVVHPTRSFAAALASCAAHKRKKFDLMEDKLWEAYRQRQFDIHDVDLGNGPQKCWDTPDGCPIVVGIARDLGLDVDRFRTDMQACVPIVNADMQEMQQTFAVSGTPAFFINGRYISGAVPTASFVTIIDEELAKATARIRAGTPTARYYRTWVIGKGVKRVDSVAPSRPTPRPRPKVREPDRALTYAVAVDGFPASGRADAKITIVFIYDHASPYAERSRPVLADLSRKYGADLRIVYRTRMVHPHKAMAGALATCAAAKQNKFSAMDDAVWDRGFKNRTFDLSDVDLGQGQKQKCWDTAEGCTNVVGYAKDLGLDVARFKADMKKCVARVTNDDQDLGTNFAVNATPTFFINGRHISGGRPIEAFIPLVEDELVKANARIRKGTPKWRYYRSWVIGKGEKKVILPNP